MQIGKVVGTVVATQKIDSLEGLKLLLVAQIDPLTCQEKKNYVVAIDAVQAGVGEVVLYASGSSARQTTMTLNKPADAIIMAVIDTWDVAGKTIFQKDQPLESS